MAYGKIKADTLTYDNSGTDVDVLISNLAGAGGAAATGSANTFTATQTFNGGINVSAETVAALDIDLSTGNYFTKTINGNSTFTFSNPPASGTVGSFTLELTHTSGTVTWPTSVKWPADTAPTLTAGKTHLFVFVTDDNGSYYTTTSPGIRRGDRGYSGYH